MLELVQPSLIQGLDIPGSLGEEAIEAGLIGGPGELVVDTQDGLAVGDHQPGEILGEVTTLGLVREEVAEVVEGVEDQLGEFDDPWHDRMLRDPTAPEPIRQKPTRFAYFTNVVGWFAKDQLPRSPISTRWPWNRSWPTCSRRPAQAGPEDAGRPARLAPPRAGRRRHLSGPGRRRRLGRTSRHQHRQAQGQRPDRCPPGRSKRAAPGRQRPRRRDQRAGLGTPAVDHRGPSTSMIAAISTSR